MVYTVMCNNLDLMIRCHLPIITTVYASDSSWSQPYSLVLNTIQMKLNVPGVRKLFRHFPNWGNTYLLHPVESTLLGERLKKPKMKASLVIFIYSLLFKSTDDGDPAADNWDPFDESDNESDSALAAPVTSSHTLSSTAAAFPKMPRTQISPATSGARFRKETHPNPSFAQKGGRNIIEQMDSDKLYAEHQSNIFYPFSSQADWDLATWLTTTSLTNRQIDNFCQLSYVRLSLPSVLV